MKRGLTVICGLMLTASLAACGADGDPSSAVSPAVSSPLEIENGGQPDAGRRIQITSENGSVIVFALNDSAAATALYNQLPLYVEAENYSNNEIIWYPPENKWNWEQMNAIFLSAENILSNGKPVRMKKKIWR